MVQLQPSPLYLFSSYTELEVDELLHAADILNLNLHCDKKYHGFHNN